MPPAPGDRVGVAEKDPVVAIRDVYLRILFTEQAADLLVSDEGLDSLERIRSLNSAAAVASLCHNLRRRALVSQLAESNMGLLVFWLKHQARTSRQARAGDVTVEAIESLRCLRDDEDEAKRGVRPAVVTKPKIDADNWVQTFLDIQNYLARHVGCTNVPLLYVVRENPTVDPKDSQKAYDSPREEMIARAPHGTDAFRVDNVKVYDLLMEVCGTDHLCRPHMEPARPASDGRRAYQLLFDFHVGRDSGDRLASRAEAELQSFVYSGANEDPSRCRSRGVPFRSFDRYVTAHKKQHNVLDTLEKWGYHRYVSASQRIRYFLDGICGEDTLKGLIRRSEPYMKLDVGALLDHCQRVLNYEEIMALAAADTATVTCGTNRNKKRKYQHNRF